MKKLLKSLLVIFTGVLILGLICVVPVDQTPFKETEFYATSLANLTQVLASSPTSQDSLQIGWGLANLAPPQPIRLTGKNWSPYEQVFDSVYVRCFLVSNHMTTIAIINYDLWIMHPHLTEKIKDRISQTYPDIHGLYFTANHSHTSIGGWASGLLGTLVIGGNSPETVTYIEDQTLMALAQAQESQSTAYIGYAEIPTEGLVENRLDKKGKLDTYIRILEIQNQQQRASFSTYAAHSVYMNKDINTLSADYPGDYLANLTARTDLDFAAFAPGATGSHTPIGRKPFSREKMSNYALQLVDYYQSARTSIVLDSMPDLRYIHWPIETRSAHFRVSNYWRLRPGIFNTVMGNPQPYISAIKIGSNVLVGLPIELSGEYYQEFEAVCKRRGLNLIITSFNGTYLGYANPKHYYFTLRRAETREMNWFGPESGEYFVELINHLLEEI